MAKSYWEKLRDPRWQRRRLEIMQRADFSCERCGSKEDTLNVHHKLYRKNAEPWEYADLELQCLCEACHDGEHVARDELKALLSRCDEEDIQRLVGYVKAVLNERLWEIESESAWDEQIKISHPEQLYGIGDFLGLWPSDPEWSSLEQPNIRAGDLIGIGVSVTKRRRIVVARD